MEARIRDHRIQALRTSGEGIHEKEGGSTTDTCPAGDSSPATRVGEDPRPTTSLTAGGYATRQ